MESSEDSSRQRAMDRAREIAILVLIVVADYVPAPITTVALACLAGWYFMQSGLRIPIRLPGLLWLPAVLLILGLPGFLFHDPILAVKDLWRFANYPLVITVGFLATRRFRRLGRALRPFVIAAGVACLIHLGARLAGQELPIRFGPLQQEYGRAPFSSLVGVIVLALAPLYGFRLGLSRFMRGTILILCATTLLASESRTLIGSTLFVVTSLALWRASTLLRWAAIAGLAVAAAVALPHLADEPGSIEWTGLRARAGTTFQELTRTSFRNPRDIARFWRAYETSVAWKSFRSGTPLQLMVGRGFGEQLDLGRTQPLGFNERRWRAIPVLHNAYLYLLIKTGVLGLALHVAFLLTLPRFGFRTTGEGRVARRLLHLLVICLLAWSVVISGVFQRHGPFTVLLLVGTLAAQLDRSRPTPSARTPRECVSPALN